MKTCYWQLQKTEADEVAYAEAAKLVQAGEVVSFPTETVYGLGADGLNETAVKKIFEAKGRPNDNPLILHIADIKDIEPLTTGLNANAKALAEAFWPGPLTLIVNKSAIIPDAVTAGLDTVAVRFPGNPEARAFIKVCGCPIAAPSANISGRPSPTNAQDVLEDMQGKVAGVLDGGSCAIGVESTIVDTTTPVPMILRPGGITYEQLVEVLGEVEIDKALMGNTDFKPKAPGMKYRHYAPKAKMYLLEAGYETEQMIVLAELVLRAFDKGLKVGVICENRFKAFIYISMQMMGRGDILNEKEDPEKLRKLKENLIVSSWGKSKAELMEKLFYILRDFDRTEPDVIIAQAVAEDGVGLAIMNRMRKAAGYQEIMGTIDTVNPKSVYNMKNGGALPDFI